jgi:hypothetical protein
MRALRCAATTIWLTQKMIAPLYDVTVPAINQHLKRIFGDSELEEASVVKQYLITAADGKNYKTKHSFGFGTEKFFTSGPRVSRPHIGTLEQRHYKPARRVEDVLRFALQEAPASERMFWVLFRGPVSCSSCAAFQKTRLDPRPQFSTVWTPSGRVLTKLFS